MKVREFFNQRCTVFWATTYTFDIEGFESHLLSRLGGAPLNAVVLADQSRLEADWAQLASSGELFQLGRAGRQYLLRGVEWPHRFHPKTYFFCRPDESVLVVGSGNCGLNGLLNGNEVMAKFSSKNPEGLAAIRDWALWVTRVVRGLNDRLCSEQWDSARRALPSFKDAAATSTFVHNLDTSMRDQLQAAITGAVDELHLLAPFCDPGARAIAALVADMQPKRLRLYAPESMAVNGADLLQVLRRSGAEVEVLRPDPQQYVHAKLVGAVHGERGWLLSGSANLSQSALLAVGTAANCEAGTLVAAPAPSIQGFFESAGVGWTGVSIDSLAALKHDLPPESDPSPLRLLRASVDDHGVITARFRIVEAASEYHLRLWRSEDQSEISATLLPGLDEAGLQVVQAAASNADLEDVYACCLVADALVSGYVPLEDPSALRSLLQAAKRREVDPDSWTPNDLSSPLGKLILWMRERTDFSAIMEDEAALRTIDRSDAGMGEQDGDEEVIVNDLEVLLRRRHAHQPEARNSGPTIDELLAEIQALRDSTPSAAGHLHLVRGAPQPASVDRPAGARWSPTRREQVLLGNAVDRMCRAAGDLRIFDRSPIQAGRNIGTTIDVLHACRFRDEWGDFLSQERIPVLVEHLMVSVAGGDGLPGLLQRLTAADLNELRQAIPHESKVRLASLVVGCLVADTLQGRQRIYTAQTAIRDCVDHGVAIPVDEETRQRLAFLIRLNDDEHWLATIWRDYRVGVRIHRTPATRWLLISPPVSIVDDPSVVAVVREWFDYTSEVGWGHEHVGVANYDGHAKEGLGTTRLSLTVGDSAWLARENQDDTSSRRPLTADLVEQLIKDKRPWSDIFPGPSPTAAAGVGV